jgi:hypothetical protein
LQTCRVWKPALSDKPLAGRFRLLHLHKDDGAGRAVLLTRPTLDAHIDVDLALGLTFLDGAARAANHTRSAQDTFISDYVRHCSILDVRAPMLPAD